VVGRGRQAHRTVKAEADRNQAEIQAKVDEARRDADERAAELRAKGDEAARDAACGRLPLQRTVARANRVESTSI
jgi:hypothetical protein